ncbi:hypothetical protein B0T09DRAFT_134978 [Sordaria sp. MPI-SDFR-AT-0083]|nr:hypothetical protein B0T09DRAFT_134978 [Sordaria sp. MPI-SDFR-AT-0083]
MLVIQEVAVRTWEEDHERVKFLLGHITVPYSVMSKERGGWVPQAYIDVQQRVADPENITSSEPQTGYTRLVWNGLHNINHVWCVLQKMFAQDPTAESWPIDIQLSYLLFIFSEFKATEPRDRLYAFIGLLLGPEDMKLPTHLLPDYTKHREEVFHEYTVWILQEIGIIDVLSLHTGERTGRTCPSWVPNFEGRRKSFEDACIVTEEPLPLKLLEGNRVLEADALLVGVILAIASPLEVAEKTSSTTTTSALIERVRETLRGWEGWLEMLFETTPEPFEDRAWRRQLSDYFDQAFVEADRGYGRVNYEKGALSNALSRDKPEPGGHPSIFGKLCATSPSVLSYADFTANEFEGLVPFTTRRGHFDFCSSKSEIPEYGDVVCLLRGSSKQFILRRAPPDALGEWTMVGTVYNDADKTRLYRAAVRPLRDHLVPGSDKIAVALYDALEEFFGGPKQYNRI